ncbi:hypothetical protein PV10_01819 [Exophiala mesophila]|uniref:Phosphoribulokinase/uridine kinase domain-containing protein n=1 Tax=Exophiala mesophila TaxID=212818 RepID=A0A0D1ZVV8_EXOME|nr:uncharacterized protein PV10_01819 [Exophiala mesophila]KIV98139.1 hypothetical protein PV10_01819 [Exophiala mesophila]
MATTKAESPSTTPSPSPPLTILLGLSGPSSSGKTTLARLLRTIFQVNRATATGPDASRPKPSLSLFIIHQDDFYLTDTLVPVRRISSQEFGTRDLQDWDCVESLDLKLFEDTLRHVQAHGVVPAGSVSKEDENSVGESGVSDEVVEQHGAQVQAWFDGLISSLSDVDTLRDIRICILDGFLLYPPPPSLRSSSTSTAPTTTSSDPLSQLHHLTSTLLSPRLFLPTILPRLLHRRLNRTGYVTLEGFWTDPPGYCQDLVWPNYVRDHAWMYVGGEVNGGEGVFDQKVLAQQGITVCPGAGAWPMSQVLSWAVDQVWAEVERRIKEDRGIMGHQDME